MRDFIANGNDYLLFLFLLTRLVNIKTILKPLCQNLARPLKVDLFIFLYKTVADRFYRCNLYPCTQFYFTYSRFNTCAVDEGVYKLLTRTITSALNTKVKVLMCQLHDVFCCLFYLALLDSYSMMLLHFKQTNCSW